MAVDHDVIGFVSPARLSLHAWSVGVKPGELLKVGNRDVTAC